MLVLSRKIGERIQIGDGVFVVVQKINKKTVSLGIEAPREINIVREELTIDVPTPVALTAAPTPLPELAGQVA